MKIMNITLLRISKTTLTSLLLWPMISWSAGFPLEVESDLHGLDIEVIPSTSTSPNISIGTLRIRNRADVPVNCQGVFTSGPETSRRRSVKLQPGEEGSLSFRARRTVVRMRSQLECTAETNN